MRKRPQRRMFMTALIGTLAVLATLTASADNPEDSDWLPREPLPAHEGYADVFVWGAIGYPDQRTFRCYPSESYAPDDPWWGIYFQAQHTGRATRSVQGQQDDT